MLSLTRYVQLLRILYGDSVVSASSRSDGKQLSCVPAPLREFYQSYERLDLPFGSIFPLDAAMEESKAEPFQSEGWFAFGFDGYFSFWLCACDAPADGLYFTSWDHEAEDTVDGGVYDSLTAFLEGMREEYEAGSGQNQFEPLGMDEEAYFSLYLTGVGEQESKLLVFLKRFFEDADYQQTKARLDALPLLLLSARKERIDALEKELEKRGAQYRQEPIAIEDFLRALRQKNAAGDG